MADSDRGDTTPAESAGALPQRRVSVNQLVGYNMTWFRKAAGLTQDALGKRLGGWSGASVSAAERSWEGTRIRKFDADEIVQIAAALEVPVIALLLPPPDAGTVIDYVFDNGIEGPSGLAEYLAHVLPSSTDSPAMDAYHDRLIAMGASRYGYDTVADAVLQRARREIDDIFIHARREAETVTGSARHRAEALERDAQERHRQYLGSLVATREELEKRVDDLRGFEREYRSRLLAYLEEQVRHLKAGVDEDTFPLLAAGDDSEEQP